MKVRVLVYPRREILDPQGQAVRAALERAGFQGVGEVRVGKSFILELGAVDAEHAELEARRMAEDLLANPVVEEFHVEVIEDQRG